MVMGTSPCANVLASRNVRVDVLAMLFGIGTWLGVNSMYLQLPLLVANAPEGWRLPSFLIIATQIANIGPLLYTLVQKYSPIKINDAKLIYAIYAIGFAAALCMAFFFESTAYVAGEERSVAVMVITVFLALVGCTSSVLFMPYMGRFKEIYLITYLVGEGLSGLLPSIVALIQGVGGNPECILNETDDGSQYILYSSPPLFGTRDFFIFVFALMVISGIAYALLNTMQICKMEYAVVTIKYGNDYKYGNSEKPNDSEEYKDDEILEKKINGDEDNGHILHRTNYVYLMIVMGLVCMFGNTIFNSLQSYSCLPYGNLAYHLTVTLSAIANPVACFMAVFLPHKSIKHITLLFLLTALIAVYALTTAVLSPTPPMIGMAIGEAICVISWTLLAGLVGYMKLSITTIFRYQGGQSLVWVGAVSQVGSLIGAVVSFCLVNFTDIFVSYTPSCPL